MTDTPIIASPWGGFTRATTTLTDGEVLVHDTYLLHAETAPAPELMLTTADPDEAAALVERLGAFAADVPGWTRRATDAVVTHLSEETPAEAELDDAATDLALQTVEARPGGDLVLHLDDTCGEHLPHGYWPAVRFDASGAVAGVTVEA